jgi:hypothetical protein
VDAALLKARRQHQAEHLLVAHQRRLAIRVDVVHRRRLRQSRQEGRLRQRQVLGAAPEVRLRRRLDSVRQVAVVDLIQVDLQDLVPRVASRDLRRQKDLARLPQIRALGTLARAQQDRACHLLRDGRRARHGFTADVVLPQCARDGKHVISGMAVEILVLGGDRGRHQVRGDPLQRHERSPAGVRVDDLVEQVAVSVQDAGLEL